MRLSKEEIYNKLAEHDIVNFMDAETILMSISLVEFLVNYEALLLDPNTFNDSRKLRVVDRDNRCYEYFYRMGNPVHKTFKFIRELM